MTLKLILRKVSALVLAAAVLAPSASALNEYYSISRSVRALGMGGAFYGLSDDQHALFYNPAGLSVYQGGSHTKLQIQGDFATAIPSVIGSFTQTSKQDIASVVNDLSQYAGTPLYLNATPLFLYYMRKHFALGLLVGDTKVDIAMLGRDLATSIDVTAISDTGVFAGFAAEFFPNWHIGINAKAMFRAGGHKAFALTDIAAGGKILNDISDLGGAGGGVDFDIGTTFVNPVPFIGTRESLSLVLNNVLASKLDMAKAEGTPPGLPRLLTLAGHTRLPGFGIIKHFDVVVDLAEFQLGGQSDGHFGARYGSIFKHLNWGVEMPFGWFALRAGFRQGNLSAGVGADLRFLRLDLATYAEEVFNVPGMLTSRRVALSLAFGWGGAAPEAVTPKTDETSPEKAEEQEAEKAVEKAPEEKPQENVQEKAPEQAPEKAPAKDEKTDKPADPSADKPADATPEKDPASVESASDVEKAVESQE